MKYTKIQKDGETYYRCTFRQQNGKYKQITAKTEADLDEKMFSYQLAERKGEVPTSKNVNVQTWAWEWLDVYKRGQIIDKSLKIYESVLNKYILPEIGTMRLSEVRKIHLQKIVNKNEQLSKSHLQKIKNALTGMFSEAVENHLLTENPAKKLKIPKTAVEGTHRPLTAEEEVLFLRVAPNNKHGSWAFCMYYCGLRDEEVAALKVKHVRIAERSIRIIEAFESGTTSEKSTKTESGERDVPIPAAYLPILTEQIKGKSPNDYVFTTPGGKPMNASRMAKYFANIRRDMDIADGAEVKNNQIVNSVWADFWEEQPLTPYCLRHTYCTNLQKAGIPLNVAKYLMGHKSVEMTAKIYTHQTDDQTAAALQKIDEWHDKSGAKQDGFCE